ncbi:MAG: metallophosphoesterase [Methylococcales bacterium]
MAKHLVIPDVQVKPGQDFSFLRHVGEYIVEKKPDTIICIGDFADMPSLSSYDVGKKSFEGRRYKADVLAAREAMTTLLKPLVSYNRNAILQKRKRYHPQLILTLGNHENRINRVIDADPKLDGTISVDDLQYENMGWRVYPYLEPVIVDGIAYSHFFTSGVLGRPVTSARVLVQKKHMSCVMGHVQNFEVHTEYRGDGARVTGMFAGCCYEHHEDYLGPQGNNHFRGVHMLHEVSDGEFDHMAVSLKYLRKKYTNV